MNLFQSGINALVWRLLDRSSGDAECSIFGSIFPVNLATAFANDLSSSLLVESVWIAGE